MLTGMRRPLPPLAALVAPLEPAGAPQYGGTDAVDDADPDPLPQATHHEQP